MQCGCEYSYSPVNISYAEFVIVSKEVSTLENEMLEFKDSLAEWKGMPSLLHIDDSASLAGASFVGQSIYVRSHSRLPHCRAQKERSIVYR